MRAWSWRDSGGGKSRAPGKTILVNTRTPSENFCSGIKRSEIMCFVGRRLQSNPAHGVTHQAGTVKASFAVDTGAVVNILSEKPYRLIKRASRGSRWPLRSHDLNLMGVSSEPLYILGVVRFPIILGKGSSRLCLDFYVVPDFSLPSDCLLGLTSLKSSRIVVHPDTNLVTFQGKSFQAMETPMHLTALREQEKE